MKLIPRARWGARPPSATLIYLKSALGVKVHYTGSYVDPRLADDHDRCAGLVRQIQNGHMDGNDWSDIGYSFLVCPHGYVFEGRGLHRLPAANGSGLNAGHYAVLGMVGNSGLTVPSAAMLDGIREAISYCRNKGAAASEIKGHRDGYATDCPGPALYAWVQAGAPRPQDLTWTETIVQQLPTLRLGHSGENVETLQGLLIARSHPEVKVSGVFDATTKTAVQEVQTWGGAEPDGIVGPKTWPILLRVH